jgi:hypothetical protein
MHQCIDTRTLTNMNRAHQGSGAIGVAFALSLFHLTVGLAHADGWKGPGVVSYVRPEIYRQTNEGGSQFLWAQPFRFLNVGAELPG